MAIKVISFIVAIITVYLPVPSLFAGEWPPTAKRDYTFPGVEKDKIFSALGLRMSNEGNFVLLDGMEECGDMSPDFEGIDLNGDGTNEVFVFWGNHCSCGLAERCLTLLIRNSEGIYNKNVSFPAVNYQILATRNTRFPDLKFGGPGFCHPIWGWNGNAYEHMRNEPEVEGGCDTIKSSNNRRDRL